jgi:hypothetical protein
MPVLASGISRVTGYAYQGNDVRDLLQRLHRALPRVEQWITDLRARHFQGSIAASEVEYPRLAVHFPMDLLKVTRVASVGRIPFPPVSSYGLPEFEAMAGMPMAGITFRDMYFVQPSHSSEGIHFHELVHVVQWSTLGVRDFLLTYALGIVQHGYAESPLEAIAYDLQARFEQGMALPLVAEPIARHAIEARETAMVVFRAHGLALGEQ